MNDKASAETTILPSPHSFKKRHGTTTFHVNVYSNPHAKETAEDKIARLIRNEAESFAYSDFPTGVINK